jgi:hypothetical protein
VAQTMTDRIEAVFNAAVAAKRNMQASANDVAAAEETAKMDNLDEWVGAKNNDVRRSIILRELDDDEAYYVARQLYRDARDSYRLALLEIERLKLLVAWERGA